MSKNHKVKLNLANIDKLMIHLKTLTKKYGKGNVPIEEALKFAFKWESVKWESVFTK